MMACFLFALDKRPGVCPVEIGETLCHVITKLIMRAVEDQTKTVCRSLQLCAVIEAGKEVVTHTMVQRRR